MKPSPLAQRAELYARNAMEWLYSPGVETVTRDAVAGAIARAFMEGYAAQVEDAGRPRRAR